MQLVRIEGPGFVAGVIVGIAAAPIVGFMRTWDHARIVRYCFRKRWRVSDVPLLVTYE